ncbi:MAG TPA: hypothetical protein GXZ47_07100 [Treponema sp.]|nr:hypothetical protein [Treponema sp.]
MKNNTIGISFDDFLEAEGIANEVESGAIKKRINIPGNRKRVQLDKRADARKHSPTVSAFAD